MRLTTESHRPVLERLEGRRLFSGNVTVTIPSADIVQLRGDGKFNVISVTMTPSRTKYVITGLEGTTIDGKASKTVAVGPGEASTITATLGAGNDRLIFAGGHYDHIYIDGGADDDVVSMTDFIALGRVEIYTRGGDDLVMLGPGMQVWHSLLVDTGSGDDAISLVLGEVDAVGGEAWFDGGDGFDTFAATHPVGSPMITRNIEQLGIGI
jgi:hypothetical protein